MIGRKNQADSTIIVPNKISIRAGLLINQVKKTEVYEFIKLFDLGAKFGASYYKELAEQLFESGELNAAAKVLIN